MVGVALPMQCLKVPQTSHLTSAQRLAVAAWRQQSHRAPTARRTSTVSQTCPTPRRFRDDKSSPPNLLTRRAPRRTYYTSTAPEPPPYPPVESAILAAAYEHIPTTGFTIESLRLGALDAGYLTASTNLFPNGAFDLVLYHLVRERLALKDRVQFPTPPTTEQGADPAQGKPLGTGAKVRSLILARLHANEPVIHKLQEALTLMSLLGNIPASVAELARLVDEIWYLAGDESVDGSWYTKRALLAGVYASSEMFMTQDTSVGFKQTEEFVDRRLEDVKAVGSTAGAVTEWVGFTGLATVNVLRSWGVRI